MIKVDNAIIMAAGISSRFVPLSYEIHKALIEVKGEVLIERQIKQLKSAGINNITIVTGYLASQFEYLKTKYQVNLVYNDQYQKRNNNSSLYLVRHLLKNTYICSADNYFSENVFEAEVSQPYYSCVYVSGKTKEWCVSENAEGYINSVKVGGKDSWVMLGHVFFDETFSKQFVTILEEVYPQESTKDMLWERIYMQHLDRLKLSVRKYDDTLVFEFDSLDELRDFDDRYYDLDFPILRNIEKVLGSKQSELSCFAPVLKGLMNLSFKFDYKGECYIYRHPGKSTIGIINRASEKFSQIKAKQLGLDETLIYFDDEGWKLSKYYDECVDFDYHNDCHVAEAMRLLKCLHDEAIETEYEFGLWEKTLDYINKIKPTSRFVFNDFFELFNSIETLNNEVELNSRPKILCHMDAYDTNYLITKDRMFLIDWEFSGSADPACDLGTFLCCSDYSLEKSIEVLQMYLGEVDKATYKHFVGYIAITSFQWLTWALYKESIGDDVGDYVNIYYKHTVNFLNEYRNDTLK